MDDSLRAVRLRLALVACLVPALAHGAGALPGVILLITLDTTRADHLSAYGYGRPTSPALERLAAEGVRFERMITPLPLTDPAHASILTGLLPRTHGIRMNGHPLPDPGIATLATWARGLGYHTAAFVSRAHLRPSEMRLRGFEHEDGPSGAQRAGSATFRRATTWMRDTTKPLFVWVHLFDPHAPYDAPNGVGRRWLTGDDPPPLYLGNSAGRPFYTKRQVRALTARYDAEIAYADHLVGRLVAFTRGLTAREAPPLVVIAGDHGETLGERDACCHYAFDHGQLLHQDVLLVPLLLWWGEKLPAGRIAVEPGSLVDLAPTLFDVLAQPGFATQGTSLAGHIWARAPAGRRLVFTERRLLPLSKQLRWRSREQFAVQDGRYKLILSAPFSRTQLFDLAADPGETRDLARELPAVETELRMAIERWRQETPSAGSSDATVPSDKRDALRALGYVE